jgi:stage II sporulation protein E
MGTGLGAVQEGRTAGVMVRRLLCAGYPAEYALRSINSICALRDRAGAVTMDLAEFRLDSGKVSVYKWGAAPSYLLGRKGTEKIGTATPPPGICVEQSRETVDRLSLCRGEVLILVSDGAEIGEILRRGVIAPLPPGELAEWLLKECRGTGEDDATVAVLRLTRRRLSA